MNMSLIVAMSREGVIGVGNELPWRLRSDLDLFREMTMGKHIIMGANTHESIGRPLPGRTNVVVSRRRMYREVSVVREAPHIPGAFVIGGAQLYDHYLKAGLIGEMIVTFVDASIGSKQGSKLAFFQVSHFGDFVPTQQIASQTADDRNEYSFKTVKYIRR
jgi:dihydrofolate reductase